MTHEYITALLARADANSIDVWAEHVAGNCPDCGRVEQHRGRCPYCLSECAPVGGSVYLKHRAATEGARP